MKRTGEIKRSLSTTYGGLPNPKVIDTNYLASSIICALSHLFLSILKTSALRVRADTILTSCAAARGVFCFMHKITNK